MAEASELPAAKPGSRKKGCGCWFRCLLYAFILLIVLGIALGPITGSPQHARALEAGYNTELIALFLHRYSMDHHGQYPSGKSSTEIFQKLLDGEYTYEPRIFFSPGSPGKTEPPITENYKLKPENVCYDVTIPVEANSPKDLPLVFMTGYRIIYLPGASAVPLSSTMKDRNPCIAVDYNNGTFAFFRNVSWFGIGEYRSPGGFQNQYFLPDEAKQKQGGRLLRDGTITNFIPLTFDPAGKKYQQLTPDGPLSP